MDRQAPKKIRIAHLSPTYYSSESIVGGGERYVDYINQAIYAVGNVEQCVFTIGNEEKLFIHNGIPVRMFKNQSKQPGNMDGFSAGLWRELPGFDLVHIHQILTGFGVYSALIARSLGIPIVGTDLGGGEHPLMLEKRGINIVDGVVSISQYAHKLTAPFFSGLHEVLIGPVDTDKFTLPEGQNLRKRDTVLCVSRILPHKGIDQVISALPDGLRLMVVGNVYHTDYYALLNKMSEGKNVQFINDANDSTLAEYYRTCGLFVQASTTKDVYGNFYSKPELMGLTTLEACACGMPVLVSDAGSLPELVPDDRFGRVFTSQDALKKMLIEYADGTWPAADVSDLARLHVIENHSMQVVGERLAGFYQKVLDLRK